MAALAGRSAPDEDDAGNRVAHLHKVGDHLAGVVRAGRAGSDAEDGCVRVAGEQQVLVLAACSVEQLLERLRAEDRL
jgi:hypothetical protein